MYKVNSPVLLLIFNRPDETQKVFDSIKAAKPERLFIAADGARLNNKSDEVLCAQTRAITKQVDWHCEVKTLFHQENLGCKNAVSKNISWFFTHVEEGIILEDDCLPNQHFFRFCDDLLNKYREDARVRHISGSNLNPSTKKVNADTYRFSKLTQVWGWASWQRVWKDYDVNMPKFAEWNNYKPLRNIFFDVEVCKFLYDQYSKTYQNLINTWDYQYAFSNLIEGGLCIIPNENLVSNIGFSGTATHTTKEKSKFANLKSGEFESFKHPESFIPDVNLDIKLIKSQMPPKFNVLKQQLKNHLFRTKQ